MRFKISDEDDLDIYETQIKQDIEDIMENNLFVTTLDAIQLKRIIRFIEKEQNWIKKEPYELESYGKKLSEIEWQKYMEKRFPLIQQMEKIKLICKKEFHFRTRHINEKKPNTYHLKDWMKEPEKFDKLWQLINEKTKQAHISKNYYSGLLYDLDVKGYLIKSNAEERCSIASFMFATDCSGQISNHSKDGKKWAKDLKFIPLCKDL